MIGLVWIFGQLYLLCYNITLDQPNNSLPRQKFPTGKEIRDLRHLSRLAVPQKAKPQTAGRETDVVAANASVARIVGKSCVQRATPEIQTLTLAAICCLSIFNTYGIDDVEAKAPSSRIQDQGGVGSAERQRDGQRAGQSVQGPPYVDPSIEARST